MLQKSSSGPYWQDVYCWTQVNDKSVLKFALCYGFRNLQNVVRKLKMGKCDYHFLEIMACPSGDNLDLSILWIIAPSLLASILQLFVFNFPLVIVGCLNGGGQIKRQPGQSAKEFIQLLETAYVENVSYMFGRVCHNIIILDYRNFLSSLKALLIICGKSEECTMCYFNCKAWDIHLWLLSSSQTWTCWNGSSLFCSDLYECLPTGTLSVIKTCLFWLLFCPVLRDDEVYEHSSLNQIQMN